MSQNDFVSWLTGYVEATADYADLEDEDLAEAILTSIKVKLKEVKEAEKARLASVTTNPRPITNWGGIANCVDVGVVGYGTLTVPSPPYGEKAAEDIFPPKKG